MDKLNRFQIAIWVVYNIKLNVDGGIVCIKQLEGDYVGLGSGLGECIILKKIDNQWYNYRKFQFNDKPITGMILLDTNSIVVTSEDRRLSLVNLISV